MSGTSASLNKVHLPNVRYGTSGPVQLASDKKGDEFLITPSGDGLTAPTESWIFDGLVWVLRPAGTSPNVRYGLNAPVVLPTDLEGDSYHQTSTGDVTGVLMNTWTYDGSLWFNESQPIDITWAELNNLKTLGLLRQSQHYKIPLSQDRLTGSLILHVSSDSSVAREVIVNTQYGNGWQGTYDVVGNLLVSLTDDKNNTVTHLSDVGLWDWGNPNHHDNFFQNVTFVSNYPATHEMYSNEISDSTLDVISFVGTLSHSKMDNSSMSLNGAQVSVYDWNISMSSVIDIDNYTAGNVIKRHILRESTFDISGSSSAYSIEYAEIIRSTVEHIGVTTGRLTSASDVRFDVTLPVMYLSNSVLEHKEGALDFGIRDLTSHYSNISHTGGLLTFNSVETNSTDFTQTSGDSDFSRVFFSTKSVIELKGTGIFTMLDTTMMESSSIRFGGVSNANISRCSLSSGQMTLLGNAANTSFLFDQCRIVEDANITMFGAATDLSHFILRTEFSGKSTLLLSAPSLATLNITDSKFMNGSALSVLGSGNCTIANTSISAAGKLRLNSSGTFTLTNSEIAGTPSSVSVGADISITMAGTRNVNIDRLMSVFSYLRFLGDTGTTTFNKVEFFHSGCDIAGSGGNHTVSSCKFVNFQEGYALRITTLNLTNGDIRLNQVNTENSQVLITDVPLGLDLGSSTCTDGYIKFLNNTAKLTVSRLSLAESSAVEIYNNTTAFSISKISADQSYVTILNDPLLVQNISVRQGQLTIPGGQVTFLVQTGGRLDTGGFTQTGIFFSSNNTKLLTANNANASEYLGLTSSLPLI